MLDAHQESLLALEELRARMPALSRGRLDRGRHMSLTNVFGSVGPGFTITFGPKKLKPGKYTFGTRALGGIARVSYPT